MVPKILIGNCKDYNPKMLKLGSSCMLDRTVGKQGEVEKTLGLQGVLGVWQVILGAWLTH